LLGRLARTRWLPEQMARRLKVITRWIVVPILFLAFLQEMGLFNNAWAWVSTAAAAIAVGFVATWSILSNGVCALLILVYRPFHIGDTIEVKDLGDDFGVRGEVIEMNLMYTTLRGEEGGKLRTTLVPNNFFFQKVTQIIHLQSSVDGNL